MGVERLKECAHCGSTWKVEEKEESNADAGAGDVCPVCGYRLNPACPDAEEQHALSIGELEQQLNALVRDAYAAGIYPATIVCVLRSELEYAAELATRGRRFIVQVIDLGPQDPGAAHEQPNPRTALPRRRPT